MSTPPSNPERKPPVRKIDPNPVIRTPEEIAQMEERHKMAVARYAKLRVRSLNAQSPEGQRVLRRESLLARRDSYNDEEAWQRARIDRFAGEGVIPASDERLLEVLDGMEHGHVMSADYPPYQYVLRRVSLGQDLAQNRTALRKEIQNRMKRREQRTEREEMQQAIERVKNGSIDPQDLAKIEFWKSKGWTTEQVEEWLKRRADEDARDDEEERKRKEYENSLERLSQIHQDRRDTILELKQLQYEIDNPRRVGIARRLQGIQQEHGIQTSVNRQGLIERARKSPPAGETPRVTMSHYRRDILRRLTNATGTAAIYQYGEDSILKIAPSDYHKINKSIQVLERAKGAGGLPILEAIIVNPINGGPDGLQMERIKGRSLDDPSFDYRTDLRPEVFGGRERARFIYDLVEAYKATGEIHGDLSYVVGEAVGEPYLRVNFNNFMYEPSTNSLRMIDYGETGLPIRADSMFVVRDEISGAIELLFMDRLRAIGGPVLASNQQLQRLGQQMLDKLNIVNTVDDILQIIPVELRIT